MFLKFTTKLYKLSLGTTPVLQNCSDCNQATLKSKDTFYIYYARTHADKLVVLPSFANFAFDRTLLLVRLTVDKPFPNNPDGYFSQIKITKERSVAASATTHVSEL